jgi:hypothetical protein
MEPLNIDGQPLPPRRTNAKRWAFLVDAWALHHIAAIRISMRRHAPRLPLHCGRANALPMAGKVNALLGNRAPKARTVHARMT